MRRIAMVGQSFGLSVVLEELPRSGGRRVFLCLCGCGNTFQALGENLRKGHTKSCGCYQALQASTANFIHGESGSPNQSPEFRAWAAMRNRCTNPSNERYPRYGGRGVQVCGRWLESFANFLEDMGRRPGPEYSLERLNNDGNYEVSNCKWVSKIDQANNTINNIRYTHKGKTLTLAQWSRETGLSQGCLGYRHRQGWSVEDMLSIPAKKK